MGPVGVAARLHHLDYRLQSPVWRPSGSRRNARLGAPPASLVALSSALHAGHTPQLSSTCSSTTTMQLLSTTFPINISTRMSNTAQTTTKLHAPHRLHGCCLTAAIMTDEQAHRQQQRCYCRVVRKAPSKRAPSACLVHASQHQQPPTKAGGSAVLALTAELCA